MDARLMFLSGAVCLFCRDWHIESAPASWKPFAQGAMRCPGCITDAVETQHDARRHLPVVRQQLMDLGLSLPERVLVRMISPDEGKAAAGQVGHGIMLGFTEQITRGQGQPSVTGINIIAGLPPIFFGRAVAHEFGHAWLALQGKSPVDSLVEEGVCELFAYAWLKRHATPTADRLRRQMRANPDPLYGGGFRTVHTAVQRDGINVVLERLLRKGTLDER